MPLLLVTYAEGTERENEVVKTKNITLRQQMEQLEKVNRNYFQKRFLYP